MLDTLFSLFSHDLAIDLGTANTLVFVKGKGLAVREPSVVARHKKTKKILVIGSEAKKMIGKTPGTIEAFKPLKDGVIADFDATAEMLKFYIQKVHQKPRTSFFNPPPKPKVVIAIPSGVTEVERRAVQDAALSAGARQAFLIEEPMAAAIGCNLPIEESKGTMICDIGGGTTEIAVISLSGIVVNRSVRIAGDRMDEAIVSFCRLKHSLLLGILSAEEVKIAIGSAYPLKKELKHVVRGRSLENGLPKSIRLSSTEIREALAPIFNQIIAEISETVEETPPELVGDILEEGITLTGGGGLIRGLDKAITETTKIPTTLVEDPMTSVVRGCAKVLADKSLLEKVRVTGGLK